MALSSSSREALNKNIPCRVSQVAQLDLLFKIPKYAPSTLIVHGGEATGKSLVLRSFLDNIDIPGCIISSRECITVRHLLESILKSIQTQIYFGEDAHETRPQTLVRCESLISFIEAAQKLLVDTERFVVVLDNVDRQREALPIFYAALPRLGAILPNLSLILVVSVPKPQIWHHATIPHLHFPAYSRAETLSIVGANPPPFEATMIDSARADPAPLDVSPAAANNSTKVIQEDIIFLWTRFTAAVWDSIGHAVARDVVSFRQVCDRLWPEFTRPVLQGEFGPREFSKILIRNRSIFQNEDALLPTIPIADTMSSATTGSATSTNSTSISSTSRPKPRPRSFSLRLPFMPAHLLIASYLASYSPARQDITHFSSSAEAKRKKRGGATAVTPSRSKSISKSRHHSQTPSRSRTGHQSHLIARRPQAPSLFSLERMLAIYHALVLNSSSRIESDAAIALTGADGGKIRGGTAEILTQLATLAGLGLIVRGAVSGDLLDMAVRWRCTVSFDFIQQVARLWHVDLANYAVEL